MSIKEAWAPVKFNSFLWNTNHESKLLNVLLFLTEKPLNQTNPKWTKVRLGIFFVSICIVRGGSNSFDCDFLLFFCYFVLFHYNLGDEKKGGYKGTGDRPDLDNHGNQLNPNHPEYVIYNKIYK